MAEDNNVHSRIWNFHYYKRQNASILKENIEQFELFINNKTRRDIHPSSKEVLIIDFALLSLQLSRLTHLIRNTIKIPIIVKS